MIKKLFRFAGFLIFYIKTLIKSNLFIAHDILSVKMKIYPGFVCIPVHLKSNQQKLILVNLVSMTPGTMSVDLDEDAGMLLVHALYSNKEQEIKNEIGHLESKIKGIF